MKNRALYSKMTFPGLNPDGVPNVEGMKNDMEWFVAAGRMKEPVKMDDIIDTSFAEAAVKQLGPYRR